MERSCEMAEQKRYDHYPRYFNLSDEQKKEFKKALFLTKGAVNNDVGCTLAYIGVSGEDIAKYGASWKDVENVEQGEAIRKKKAHYGRDEKFTRKQLMRQMSRIPDLFDTIRGRALVAKYGDEVKNEFCDEHGKCALSAVTPEHMYDGILDCVEFVKGSVTGCEFNRVKRAVADGQNLNYDREKTPKLEFLERAKATEVVKAKSKGIDLAGIYTRTVKFAPRSTDGLDKVPELQKDFWKFMEQDLYALANFPIEELKQKLRLKNDDKDLENLSTVACGLGDEFIGRSYYPEDVYGVSPNARYNALYVRGMYQAMDEIGIGLATSSRLSCYARGRLHTRVQKIAKKIISLNEKYQKMLKNKSNKIEPAILRETLVGMFNEYADRSGIEYRMFVREDRPAPTLASLKPEKKSKTVTKAPKKRSTAPKEVVKVDGVGTFVEY